MTPAQELEIEVKVRLAAPEGWPARLEALGLRAVQPPQPELSTLWDRDGALLAAGCALRTRRCAGTATLTWKGPRQPDPRLKVRPERETEVADPAALDAILLALGYRPWMRMQKERGLWEGPSLVACLDRTPFGCYLELEGPRDVLEAAFLRLGLSEADIETRSYPALFREWEAGHSPVTENLPPRSEPS